MGGAKATLCCDFLIYFFLQAAEKIHGTLGVGGGSEDRAFILLEDFQPTSDVSRMILMMFYQSSDHAGTHPIVMLGLQHLRSAWIQIWKALGFLSDGLIIQFRFLPGPGYKYGKHPIT